MADTQKIWTCGAGLAQALAHAVLKGDFAQRFAAYPLPRWTILVPTRRAARLLEQELARQSGANALLLPHVRPIGDVDDDLIAAATPDETLPEALSAPALLFLLLGLVQDWARAHPHLALARDVAGAPLQAFGLAQSLKDFVEQLATEDVEPGWISKLTALDLAEHRQAILSLFDLVQEELPRRLQALNRLTPAARRNRVLHAEAARIAAGGMEGPLVAAGSTGSNPATRALLKAIASQPLGAIVLPGLDTALDDPSWEVLSPTHPQYSLKVLLADLAVARKHVKPLSPATPRMQFLQQALRPAKTSSHWREDKALAALPLADVRQGLTLVEAADRHQEARMIALALREVLETPGKQAALVTPDRNLAQAVRHELRRWQVEIDDSGGEPLARFGRARLLMRVIDYVAGGFAPEGLAALLADPAFSLDRDHHAARGLATRLELVLLRQDLPPRSVAAILPCFRLAQAWLRPDTHAPDLLRRMTDTEWDGLEAFAQTLMAALKPISNNESAGLAEHLTALQACLDALAPRGAETAAEDDALDALLQALRDDAVHHPGGTLRDALPALRWALTQETLRPPFLPGVRLSIYGLAEARMVEADLLVLGGLNENIWPAAVDAGPWLNRAMRESVGLAQPERDIGLTAHDFVQLASAPNVLLSWARRLGPAPVTPSRFVLRLEALLALMGEEEKAHHDSRLPSLAAALDAPRGATRFTVPRPAPPPVLRPTRFAVTAIEKLIRDPYAIFSQRVLKLEPLPPLGAAPEPRLRGNLFHAALAAWMRAQQAGGAPTLETLVAEGGRAFAPYMTEPEVRQFWWPRFKRIAAECVTDDQSRRADVSRSLVEIKGAMTLDIAGVPHEIQARADRIDETRGGAVRFIDYKGSTAPTAKMVKAGLSPQLTLEAAILAHGGYPADLPDTVDDLVYILLKGGSPAMEGRSLADALRKEGTTIAAQVAEHKEGLLKLLSRYQHKDQPYLPRTTVFKEQETSDYDHLSRFAEWARGG